MAALFCDCDVRKAFAPMRIIAHRRAVLKQKLDIFFFFFNSSTRWDSIYCSATPVLFSLLFGGVLVTQLRYANASFKLYAFYRQRIIMGLRTMSDVILL